MAAFTKGLEIMIVPALVVGVARGISVVLQDGMIIDSLLHHASVFVVSRLVLGTRSFVLLCTEIAETQLQSVQVASPLLIIARHPPSPEMACPP